MDSGSSERSQARFAAYVEVLFVVLGQPIDSSRRLITTFGC
jgi:hypothetical protein